MTFTYDDSLDSGQLEAYERLLYDAMHGDQMLFTDAAGIERLWQVSTPLLENAAAAPSVPEGLVGPGGGAAADRAAALVPARGRRSVSERAQQAIITGARRARASIVAVRVSMNLAFKHYLARIRRRRSEGELAGQHTRFVILRRLVTVILVAIVGWSVLQVFPATDALARSLLASRPCITIFLGIALTGPLSNLGAGVLLGWSQSVRLGDRVTIADVTGTVAEITIMQTVLVTDEGRRVFVPNSQMASSIVTNRSIDDPRRIVTVRLPVPLDDADRRGQARRALRGRGLRGRLWRRREGRRRRGDRVDGLAQAHRPPPAGQRGRRRWPPSCASAR